MNLCTYAGTVSRTFGLAAALFLVYANEFDVEGIIANQPVARERENKNPVRDGLGIVRAQIDAYALAMRIW